MWEAAPRQACGDLVEVRLVARVERDGEGAGGGRAGFTGGVDGLRELDAEREVAANDHVVGVSGKVET